MIVVSDTSPITALMAVGQEELLRLLFGEVNIPQAVGEELMRGHGAFPTWLRVEPVRRLEQEAGMYQGEDMRGRALRSVGE